MNEPRAGFITIEKVIARTLVDLAAGGTRKAIELLKRTRPEVSDLGEEQ